jgi:putative addiction module component (TIGR02574 family)
VLGLRSRIGVLVPEPAPARSLALCFNFATFPTMSTVTEIEAALEKLPPEQLHEVAAWLETRLAPIAPDSSVEDAWSDEVKRRIEELDSGRVQGVPAEQVFARARQILGR